MWQEWVDSMNDFDWWDWCDPDMFIKIITRGTDTRDLGQFLEKKFGISIYQIDNLCVVFCLDSFGL